MKLLSLTPCLKTQTNYGLCVCNDGSIKPQHDYPNINDYFYARVLCTLGGIVLGGQYEGINKSSLGWISTAIWDCLTLVPCRCPYEQHTCDQV